MVLQLQQTALNGRGQNLQVAGRFLGQLLALNRTELFLELQQPGDFCVHARAREIFQLSVVLMEAGLRAGRGMKLKIEIEILIHQRVEGGLGRRGRGRRWPLRGSQTEQRSTRQRAGVAVV